MSLVGPVIPVLSDKNEHTHADIMNDFFAASSSDEAHRNPSHHRSHSRSRSAHSHASHHSSAAEDMTAHLSTMDLQPPNFPQTQYSAPNNIYQDTQAAQPSYGSAGNNLSPSISSYHEHTTPEAFLSDHGYTDISQYTTPGFDEDLLDAQMNMSFLTVDAVNSFNTTFANSSVVSHTSSGPSSVNASNNNLLAPDFPTAYGASTHLISPSLTTHSSPGSSTECLANPSLVSAPAQNTGTAQKSLTPDVGEQSHGMSIPEQQRSPALTASPGDNYLDITEDRPAATFTSPVVRVENFSRDDSPARSNVNQSLGAKRSGNHLSPHDLDDSDEDESGQPFVQEFPIRTVPVAAPVRGEDGSWVRSSSSGHAGISPEERKDMKNVYIPTLKEQEDQRLMEEKNQDVADWLTKSEVGSEVGEPNGRPRRKKQSSTGRRRARSTNDIMSRRQEGLGVQFPAFNIPGPGLPINVESDEDDLELSDEEDETSSPGSPPAQIQVENVHEEGSYFPQMPSQADDQNLPPHVRPWRDPPRTMGPSEVQYQPDTSNAAMVKYHQRARDLETASLAATLGSARRRSESELGSILHAPGVSKQIGPSADVDKPKARTRVRKGSLLDNLKRHPTNLLKRKGSHPSHPSQQPISSPFPPTLSLETKINEAPKRTGSWGRSKSPKPDSSPTALFKDHSSLAPFTYAKNAIRRSRSRSDIGSKTPGLSELMRTHGGPPTLSLVTPANDADATNPPSHGADASGDEDDADGDEMGEVTIDLKVRSDPIIPTVEGFRSHARLLNPRLDEYMVERIAQEQNRRYKKLLDLKVKHLKAIKEKNCGSKGYCTALGGHSKILPPKNPVKDGEAPFAGFQIVISSEDEIDPSEEGTIIPKPLPAGFPIPPVKRMPAEFECPLCFKVKKFLKPSDWTKHVYEDLQPFTCTFPNCGEPMSFKRKADWVRHENERHRQLENWFCNRQGCGHTCFRKDNFVQHLVREHKVPEPKARTGRTANSANKARIDLTAWHRGEEVFGGSGDISDKVWALVEACRRDTTKQPKHEPCRFCGNICPSWKKLTVHLAKHLEQISLPILPLVENKPLNADSVISPVEKSQANRGRATSSATPSNSSRYTRNLSVNSSYSSYSSYNQEAPPSGPSTVMHTYPPPQFSNYRGQAEHPQQQTQAAAYSSDVAPGFAVRSYPGSATSSGMQGHNRLDPNQYVGSGYPPAITPVTDFAQSGQVFHSPVETGPFSTDLPSNLYAYNGPMGADFTGGLPMTGNMQDEQMNSGGQFQAGEYQQMGMPYRRQPPNYPYQG